MYKNILVPVVFDNEEKAVRAIKVARAMRDDGGRITLLHVLDEIPGFARAHIPQSSLEKSRESAGAQLREIGQKHAPDAATAVVSGHASRTILDYAEQHGADCIVIASHRPEFQDYLLGSTAAHVVRHADCSVHVIR